MILFCNSPRGRRGLWLAALCCASIPRAVAQPEYALTELSVFGRDQRESATAINHTGQVVGREWILGDRRSYLWQRGRARTLGLESYAESSAAYTINGNGVIGGSFGYDGIPVPTLWLSPDQPYSLSDFAGYCEVTAINDNGLAVGIARSRTDIQRAVYWEDDYPVILPSLQGAIAWVNGVNNLGQIVGASLDIDDREHAILWQNGQITDLNVPSDHAAIALDVNDSGHVLLFVWGDSPRPFRAYLWESGTRIDIGTLSGTGSTYAFALNNHGEAVGLDDGSGGGAFVFDRARGIRRLNDLVPPDATRFLSSAAGINDAGQIVGEASRSGRQFGFILTPRECRGFVTADADCDGAVAIADVDAFLLALGDADEYGRRHSSCNWLCNLDVNRDGRVDNFDIDPFIECYLNGGCP